MTKQCAGSPLSVRFARLQPLLNLALCAAAGALFLPQLGSAQQVSYGDFNAPQGSPSQTSTACTPASSLSGVLFCFNNGPTNTGFGFIQDFYPASIDPTGGSGSTNYALQMTTSAGVQDSSVWYAIPQNVANGFTLWYAAKITSAVGASNCCTADGLAFVIQNAAGGKTDSITNSAETGSGLTVLGVSGGGLGYAGIDNSIALEMDTFPDTWDPWDIGVGVNDDNHMALQGCGPGVANSPAHYVSNAASPLVPTSCLVALGAQYAIASNPQTSIASPSAVTLSDGNPHQVVVVYNGPNDSPANYIYVYLDPEFNPGTHTPVAGSTPVFSGPFDITKYINLNGGTAYIGFTAATGFNYEQHEIMGFSFTPHGSFGNVNVCPSGSTTPAPCSSTQPINFSVPANTTIGSVKVVTQGVAGLDFQETSSGDNCISTPSAITSCTVNVIFAPLAPGLRMGAVELFDNSNPANLVATQLIYGVGQGPAIAFGPGTQTTVPTSGLNGASSVAVDAAGNTFISTWGSQVVKVTPLGVQTAVPVTGNTLFYDLAVDGAGDVLVADYDNNRVVEVTPAGVQTTVASGLSGPNGVAVDGDGDVFVTQSASNQVIKVVPGGTQTTVPTSGVSGSTFWPAVDAAGDIFFEDNGNERVLEVTPGGIQSTVPASGLRSINGVAVDAAGDVFISDQDNNNVVEVTPGGVQTTLPATGLNIAAGLAVDGSGDVFIADFAHNRVVEVVRSLPPSLNFATTTVGSTSSDSPQSVTMQNVGNATLNYISPGLAVTGPNFVQVANLGALPNCPVSSGLLPGATCDFNVSFTPMIAGNPLTSTAVFTDNTLNAASATQTISLQGIGIQPEVAVPNVVGMTQSAAEAAITSLNLALGTETNASSSAVPSGDVISQSPLAGSLVAPLSSVNLVISTGPALVVVPNVVDLTQAAATTAITGAGLTVNGTLTNQTSSIVPSGSVISQNPAAGIQAAPGSSVSLVLSTGQPPAANQLSLLNNYFVTGDYVAEGVNLHGMGSGGTASGTIIIPKNTTGPGGTGVPDGADILAAYLYWETVENTTSPSSSSVSFDGYSITGQQIGSDQSYTDGALSGTLRVYRADVNAYIPVANDGSGIRYGSGSFKVGLPDAGGSALPLSEGASLVVIYRVLSPNFPLKSVVLYDGSAISSAATGTLSQTLQGFYDAAAGTGELTNLFAGGGTWNTSTGPATLAADASQYTETLNQGNAYAAVILSTPVTNSDNDGILDAWKAGPASPDPNHGNPGYYDVKTGAWVGLPGAVHGHKDLFVQLDYMCSAFVANSNVCDFTQQNLYPSPDANGNDPIAMVTQAFAAMTPEIYLHLAIGNPILQTTCTDNGSQLCEFPKDPGVLDWDSSLQISKVWPRDFGSCASGGDCTARFPYGQKDSYHYVLFGFSLAIPAWNSRYGTLTSIVVSGGTATITTADRGTGIEACPSRITITGVLGMPSLNGVYNTTGCADTKTITIATPPGVTNGFNYPLNDPVPEPVIGLTSGTVTSISGYSDLGGSDSAVTLGLWETAPNQDMSKRANVIAGTLFHEIGHTLGLTHGGLYYDTPGSYIPTFDANCKPNYQSVMNYLFQLDGVGPGAAVAFSNQQLANLTGPDWGVTSLTDDLGKAATFPTSAWYVPYTGSTTASPATLHCDGTPIGSDAPYYRVDGPIAPITPAWTDGQNITYDGVPSTTLRGYSDWANVDLRQVGATGGEFAALASQLSFGSSAAPLNIAAGGNVTLGSGGTVTLGSGGTVTLGSGGNVTLGSGGTIALGSGGNVTLGSGGTVTLGSGGNITLGSGATPSTVGPGTYTFSAGGSITLGSSGGTITLGSGGNVTLGSGGTITLGSGGNITLGSGGNVTLGSGGNVTLGSGLSGGLGGNVTLGSGGNVTLGSGGTVTLGSGGNVTLGSGGNVTLGSGGTITLGSGGNVTLGSGLTATIGSSGGTIALGSGGNVTLGSGLTVSLSAGGTLTSPGSSPTPVGPGPVPVPAGGTITLGSGGNVTLGSGGNVTLGSGGTIALGSGGNVTLGSGGNVTLGSGGTITLGSGGNVTLGSGGNVTLGSGGNVTLGSGGNITLGSGGNVTLGSGGNVTLGSGGATTTELTYDTANSFVRPPPSATYTVVPAGIVVNWNAPLFGVVQTYSIYRSSNGQPPVLIGSVSGGGANGFAPQTTFTDTTPDLTASTLVYTITTTLVPDTGASTQRQSLPSPPAVLTLDQTIGNLTLPSQAILNGTQPATVSAMAETKGSANGQLVSFSASGPCSAGSSTINLNGVSSATITLTNTGMCTITASQAGSTSSTGGNSYNAATPVQGTFTIQPQGSTINSQTISFGPSPNAQYGGTFSWSATSSSGLAVTLTVPKAGPCTITNSVSSGGTTMVTGTAAAAGSCAVTANQAGNSSYGAASVIESFTIAPAVLTVTATSITPTYGQVPALPGSLTYKLSGYVNNDATANPPVVTGAPTLSTTAITTSNAGSYPITVATGTLAAANYSFLYVPGTVTILPATATISISNLPSNALHGGSFTPAYAYSGNGLPMESVGSSTMGVCSVAGNLVSFVGAGICTLTASATATTDYKLATGSAQSFAVDQAPAINSANNTTFTVGTTGTFTVTTTGFPAPAITANGGLPGGVTFVDNHNGTGTLSGKATASGIYTITLTAQNGIGTAATQTFTLTSETSVPASGTTCNGVYIGTFKGNITVANGQNCIFVNGGVTGNITETGGNVGLTNATIGGSIQITAGAYSIGPTTKISGSFTAQNIPTGAAQNQVCGVSIAGNLALQSVGTAATIGAGTPACPGNSITGSVTLQTNKAPVTLTGNIVKGSLTDQSNTASSTLSGNTIGGSVTDQSNSGASVVSLNSITGNLVDQSNSASSILSQNTVGGSVTDQANTGSTQVSSNKITGTLVCQTNKTITGSGNTASKKEGQCATF